MRTVQEQKKKKNLRKLDTKIVTSMDKIIAAMQMFSPVSRGVMFILDDTAPHDLHPLQTFSANAGSNVHSLYRSVK